MKQYLSLLREVLDNGNLQANRTGVAAFRLPYGTSRTYDLSKGFPLITTKKMAWNGLVGELIAFLRAAESAADFREFGCHFWDQNANDPGTLDSPNQWLSSPYRKGTDDLGRIYGAQWRRWMGDLEYVDDSGDPEDKKSPVRLNTADGQLGVYARPLDQIMEALRTIKNNPTSRRIIINAWRPDEFRQMALPPCHVLYQFTVNVEFKEISLCMYQRSADMFLGVPMNIGSSALLLTIFAYLTGYKPRYFTHFIADAHIYENHLDQVKEQLKREPLELPAVRFSDRIKPFDGVQFQPHQIDIIAPPDIILEGYQHHDAIKAPMAV